MNQSTIRPELTSWLNTRQSLLKISKTTTTPSGQILDWVPIESQSTAKIAVPPPADPTRVTASDPKRPTKSVSFDIGEVGPVGHVPILRPNLSHLPASTTLKTYLSKQGGLLVNIKRTNKKPTDPNPAGYFHATSSESA